MIDAGVVQAIELGAELLPIAISSIKALIDAGRSPEEAQAIVKKDMASRLSTYEAERDADVEALKRKHDIDPA